MIQKLLSSLLIICSCYTTGNASDLDPFLNPSIANLRNIEKLPWQYDTGYNEVCRKQLINDQTNLTALREAILKDPTFPTCHWMLRYKVDSVALHICPNGNRKILKPDLAARKIVAMSIVEADGTCVFKPTLLKPSGMIIPASLPSTPSANECDYIPDEHTSQTEVKPVWITKDYPVIDLRPLKNTCQTPYSFEVTEILKMPEPAFLSLPPMSTWSSHYVKDSDCGALTLEGENFVKNRDPFTLTLASSTFYVVSQQVLNGVLKSSDVASLMRAFPNSVQKSIAQAKDVKGLMEFVKRLTTTCKTTILRQFVMPDACFGTNAIAFQINPGQLMPHTANLTSVLVPSRRFRYNIKNQQRCPKMSIDITPSITDPNKLCIGDRKYSKEELIKVPYETILPIGNQKIIKLPFDHQLTNDDSRFLLRFYDDEGRDCKSLVPNPEGRWLAAVFTEEIAWSPRFRKNSSLSFNSGIVCWLLISSLMLLIGEIS